MSTLRQLIRTKYNSKIKPLYIKDHCEVCGSTEDLQLHHCTFLCIIVNNVLNYLRVEEKETLEEYDEETVYTVINCVLGEHLKIDYKTLCNECHIKEHEDCVSKRFNGCGAAYYKDTWNLTDEQIQYLDINLNKKRYGKEMKREIAKTLDCRDEFGRLIDTVDGINDWFENKGVPYFIEAGKEQNKSCKKYGCWYFIIRLL